MQSIPDRVSVIVPVYNSAQSLPILVEELSRILSANTAQYELVLVNDGSRDNSWSIITDLVDTHSWISAINLMRNYGQHNALLCGIRQAQYAITVTIDDDLQHPPDEIPKLLMKLAKGYDVVYGTSQHQQHGLLRDLASTITKLVLQEAMGAQTARNISAFRAFRTQLRDAFTIYRGPYVSIDVLLTWGTSRFAAVTVRNDLRKYGASTYTLRKLILHAFNMLTGFSVWPLQAASFTGFVFTLFGIGILFYVVGRYIINGGSVPGFPFLASIIAMFSGVQLFTLGIIGEYLARMHFRTMDKPAYAVREIAGISALPPTRDEAEVRDRSRAMS